LNGDVMTVNEKIAHLRLLMKRESIDTYIVSKSDPHQSEYTQDYWNQVKYISGFTGSAGTVVITMNHAGLWTDGRYYIQAEQELAGSEFIMYGSTEHNVREYDQFAADETQEGGTIGFNGDVTSTSQARAIQNLVRFKQISLSTGIDLIGEMWKDRPELSKSLIFDHYLRFCGVSRKEKLAALRDKMKAGFAEFYVISSTDDIAWLFNLRGNDMAFTTCFESYAVIDYEKAALFADLDKAVNVKDELERDDVILLDIKEISGYLEEYTRNSGKKVVLINPRTVSHTLSSKLKSCEIVERYIDLTASMKAVKNSVELNNLEKVNLRDGVAMVRFIIWLKQNVNKGISEVDAAEKVTEFRKIGENFVEPSFSTIAAYMSNAALMHYSAVRDSCLEIKPEGILLLDSGGSYYDGTTDITRTIVLGNISDELRHDFTLVLKSHIGLADATFLYGVTGTNLDTFARMHMWKHNLDYKSGTGHGLGFFLNVHEGPQRISSIINDVVFEEDMIVTNEPGVYREGEYGIRIENTMQVVKHTENAFGRFMRFRTMSYCPIDLEGIVPEMLTLDEKKWLNEYHKTVREKLNPHLLPEEREWLASATEEM